jgi:PTS system galactitol-specific IIC component
MTGNLWYGLISALIFSALMLFFADWTAPSVQRLMGIPGISLPHGFSTVFVLPAIIVNKIIDIIPGVRDWKGDPDTINKKFGVFGEPMVVGFGLGIIIGLIGYAGIGAWTEWVKQILTLAVSMAAVMVLMPKMVALLMEGLIPLSEAARDYLQKKAGSREIYIGLDSAIAIGHPTAIATALLMVPITLVLAVILPGNRVLPFGDLATIPFMVCMMIPIVKGNVVRATITSTIVMIPTLYIMNYLSPAQTAAAQAASFEFPEGAAAISSLVDAGNWVSWIFALAAKSFWIGNILILVVLVVLWSLFKKSPAKWQAAAGYVAEEEME